MKDLPIDYLKIKTFNSKFETFKKYDKRFLSGELLESEFLPYFWSLKSLLVFYCKYIKYTYKKRGILLDFPVKILLRAKEDGIITDADTWLEYTKWVNHCVGISDNKLRREAKQRVLDKFRNKIDSMLIFMHSDEKNKLMAESELIYSDICSREYEFPDNLVNYNCEELFITEKSYKILLDFFRSYPQINRVWLHGSRAYGTCNAGSDIDLLFDCDLSAWEDVRTGVDQILVPYYMDSKNIYDKNKKDFIKCLQSQGMKKIYDKKDFEKFWSDKIFLNDCKEEIKYLHWEDYYKDTWIHAYNRILADKEDKSLSSEELYKNLEDFYHATIYLILIFMRNKGFYFNRVVITIKNAFRVGFLEDGDSWIVINDMFENPSNYSQEEVVEFCLFKNFHVFESVSKKLEGFLK